MSAKFQLLLLSAAIAVSSMGHANGDNEIEQLRQEVQQLRQLVQQYGEQQRLTQYQVAAPQHPVVSSAAKNSALSLRHLWCSDSGQNFLLLN